MVKTLYTHVENRTMKPIEIALRRGRRKKGEG
jgi:hypothetical protein